MGKYLSTKYQQYQLSDYGDMYYSVVLPQDFYPYAKGFFCRHIKRYILFDSICQEQNKNFLYFFTFFLLFIGFVTHLGGYWAV